MAGLTEELDEELSEALGAIKFTTMQQEVVVSRTRASPPGCPLSCLKHEGGQLTQHPFFRWWVGNGGRWRAGGPTLSGNLDAVGTELGGGGG